MVGVCIKYMHENYGGILQAYATVQFLESKGINYQLIRYTKKKKLIEKIKDLPRLFNAVWFNSRIEGIQRRINLKLHSEYAKHDRERMRCFATFKQKAFHCFSDEFVGYSALCDGANKYTAVITGSDQLWSPAGLGTNYYNLIFVPDNILKISLASSFGVSQIPWYQKKRTKEFLNRINYISMRENRGSEIVYELTGRVVPTILDPVFLLNREEWLKYIPNVRKIEGPYILAYFLGKTSEHRLAVKQLAKNRGMKIVALRHMDQYVKEDESFGDYAPYDVGPEEFLNLLRNAEYVCTDSFHGTAFSIMNKKQFVVFNRYSDKSKHSKNSRIDTLCANLHLENRRYRNGSDIISIAAQLIDYNKVDKYFIEQKKITDKYINTILSEIHKVEND